jgi:hypothetical protein
MLAFRGRVRDEELERYRTIDCGIALALLTEYCKADSSFVPIKNGHTHRWHVEAMGRHVELLTTGPKWFDTRANRGGGGAIDLTMHLLRLDFKQAIGKLREVLV